MMQRPTRRDILQSSASIAALSSSVGYVTGANQTKSDSSNVRFFGADRQNTGVFDQTPYRETPNVLWSYDASGNVNSVPTVVDDTIYVGTDARDLNAIDTTTGDQRWVYDSGLAGHESHISASPSIFDGAVFVAFGEGLYEDDLDEGGLIVALDAETGGVLWEFQTDTYFSTSPVPRGSTVYVGDWESNIYALDLETGDQIWSRDGGIDRTVPAVTENAVFVSDFPEWGTLSMLDAATGQTEWKFTKPESNLRSSPALDSETVYVGCMDETLYAVDAETGTKQWEYNINVESDTKQYEYNGMISCSPSVADGTVYVGTRGSRLHAVDAETGDQQWTFERDFWITGKPSIVGDVVYVGSWDGTLSALDTETGDKIWSMEFGGGLRAGVVPAEGRIYVPSSGGSLYALTNEPVHDRQSGDNTATPSPSKNKHNLSVFERFQDDPVLPLTFGGATLGGAGLAAYRWLNDTDSTEENDSDE